MRKSSQKKRIHLVPFTIKEIIQNINEIPQGVQMIQAPLIWDKSNKGDGVVIAVIDTGCQVDHPDLKDQIIGGRNFTKDYNGDPNNFNDNNGHGTHVSGIIAAAQNNSGVMGVAPLAKLLVLKVLGKSGDGNYQSIIDAINYAVKWRGPKGEKVRIISMSLGGTTDIPKLHDAVNRAVANNILVVCASGNNGDNNYKTDELNYPAAYNEAVSVGAIDFLKRITKYSNSNNNVDLVAPGNEIVSTYLDGKYAKLSGTSMATPHVSGAAALIINMCEAEFGRTLTEAEIYAQLIKRTTTLGLDKRSEGNGMLDLSKM
ncbi:S8 family peptidase [Anaerocolumna sp. AGMB13025]|uniref:S8 family peptidase n=1 Tax=Anaerocolumna sp. AGMB13025 TaxID=3039116 RepID=UPI00241C7D1D|nr:S8 family peptidase [Anaerocolumna sp. AGMB13025]WFR60102.1 S8 family peptidase [Anaerocolumna sp. AGMB13025]